jgi:hypothetical protein
LLADALPSFPATGYKGNQEDGFMGVPTKNTLKKSARMGRLAVPAGLKNIIPSDSENIETHLHAEKSAQQFP